MGRPAGRLTVVDTARDTIRRHAMLAGGDRVLVAVSGGADSVALLHVLRELAPELAVELHVAHVDHRLRADSGRDAGFVEALALRLGLPVAIVPIDVPTHGSPEAAARDARYAALGRVADAVRASRIAVGHTANDQAETVLMRLIQGAGPRGLAGIPPVRDRIVRPLIDCRRREVVESLVSVGEDWIEDPTNTDGRFLRNRLRHEVLPVFEAIATDDVIDALCRTARLSRETVQALERAAASALSRLATHEVGGLTLPLAELRALPPPVAAEVLRQASAELGRRTPLRAWAHRGLARVVAEPSPRRAFRLAGVRVDVGSGRVRIGGAPPTVAARALVVPGTTALPEIGVALLARHVDAEGYVVPRSATVAAFDVEQLSGPLRVRARRRGDRFVPFGSGARRLKAFLIDAKIPRWRRDALPLVESADGLLWIPGVRRGAAAPVTPETRRVLELSMVPLAQAVAGR